jgi:hypothetical protein
MGGTRVTGRRRSRSDVDAHQACPVAGQGKRPADLGAAIRRLRVQITRVQLAGDLRPSERQALANLIAAVARLLDEERER